MKKIVGILIFIFTIQSCESEARKNTVKSKQKSQIHNTVKPTPKKINKENNPKFFTNTFVFETYNDNGDYMLLNAKKGKEYYSFINDENDERNLLRGDVCEIKWKKDTIYIAGDGETPEIADWLVSIEKIEDGNVSKFRKEYNKKLKYNWYEDNYSQNYLDEIYLLTEYYIANSKSELIKNAIKNKDQIEYSIEKRTENDKEYDVLGIGNTFENRFIIIQWIYIDRETQKIYEYDLPNEKLNEFK